MPKIPDHELYKISHQFFNSTRYVIKTEEKFIDVNPVQEEFILLSEKDIGKFKDKFNFLHLGCIQVAAKPMTKLGLNTALLMCLRDGRHLNFDDSLIGAVQTNVANGPAWFRCFPNITICLREPHQDRLLVLNSKLHGYNMVPGAIPVVITYRIQYKLYNS